MTPLDAVRRRPLLAASAVVLVALFIQAVTRRGGDFIPVYVGAAQKLLRGEDIYQGLGYAYPPFMALLAVPFTPLPPVAIRALYFLVSAFCAVAMVRAAWRIATGGSIDCPPWDRRQWAVLLFGLLCGGPYILNTFNAQQTDLLIGALLIGGCLQLSHGRQAAGGVLIGLAAACKLTPLLFWPYLYWRRQWLAGTLVGAVALAVNLLPNAVSTPPQGGLWLAQWSAGTVGHDSPLLGAIGGRMGSLTNLSLSGTAHRLINTGLEFRSGTLEMVERSMAGPRAVIAIVLALIAVMLIASLVALVRARRAAAMNGLPPPPALEWATVTCLMLLMSPMSSSAHFNILVLAGFCLARFALATRDRILVIVLAAAGLLFALTNKEIVRETVYTVLVWSGTTTLGTLLLWAGCLRALVRYHPQPRPV